MKTLSLLLLFWKLELSPDNLMNEDELAVDADMLAWLKEANPDVEGWLELRVMVRLLKEEPDMEWQL